MNENNNLIDSSLQSQDNAQKILQAISDGELVTLDVDKDKIINNLNTFMVVEAFRQLPTILKLHELQVKCLDKYYELAMEMIDDDDVNVFVLEKMIGCINSSIEKCNSIILRLGLNKEISDSLMIKQVDQSQNINVYQSQISKQKVIEALKNLMEN